MNRYTYIKKENFAGASRPQRKGLSLLPGLLCLPATFLCAINVPAQGAPGKVVPPEVQNLINRGSSLESRGQMGAAAECYTEAIKITPADANLYFRRGIDYNSLREFQTAIKDFDKAISLDSKLAKAYMKRGWAYDQLYIFKNAASDYEKYLSMEPTSKDDEFAGCCLSDNLTQLGQYDKAIKVLNTVIEKHPKSGQARKSRGNLLNRDGGDCKQAVQDYTVVIELKDRNYGNAFDWRATAYTRLKDYPKAIADYTTMLKLFPQDDNAYRKRAAVYELMGDYKKAIGDYSAGIYQAMEGAGPFYFARARCYNKIGQPALAQKDLDECKKLDYNGK